MECRFENGQRIVKECERNVSTNLLNTERPFLDGKNKCNLIVINRHTNMWNYLTAQPSIIIVFIYSRKCISNVMVTGFNSRFSSSVLRAKVNSHKTPFLSIPWSLDFHSRTVLTCVTSWCVQHWTVALHTTRNYLIYFKKNASKRIARGANSFNANTTKRFIV